MKSSINPEEPLKGRPHGGIGILCKNTPGITYNLLDGDSSRIIGVQVIMNKYVVLNVYGIYLPHDNHKIEQLEIYMETLDQLQTCIARHQDDGAPAIVVGDTNTRLPQSLKLAKSWYKKKPFNHRSALLYNFVTDNDMIVANFKFKQQKDYTYYKT